MHPLIIELHDRNLSLRSPEGLLLRSPGILSIAGKEPVFGDAAASLQHLHPQLSFNHFWAQLGMDPLPVKNKFFRHTADMAYAHLQHMLKEASTADGLILAVPGSYNRNQLGVLLGLIKQCNVEAVGLVDSALLLAAASTENDCIIVDLQLHQCVLSRFVRSEGHLLRDRVVQVPFAGLLALRDAWLNLLGSEFVKQSRFDPQRNAETEQYLSDQMPQLLSALTQASELTVEINLKGTVHQAKVARELFEKRSQALFARITAELDQLRHPESAVHIATSQWHLPGLTTAIPGMIALDDELASSACWQHLGAIRRPANALQHVTKLPISKDTPAPAVTLQSKAPTHVLLQHKAIALPSGRLGIGKLPAGIDCARALPADSSLGSFAILRSPRGVQLELHGNTALRCNGAVPQELMFLNAGDRLQAQADGAELSLIIVESA